MQEVPHARGRQGAERHYCGSRGRSRCVEARAPRPSGDDGYVFKWSVAVAGACGGATRYERGAHHTELRSRLRLASLRPEMSRREELPGQRIVSSAAGLNPGGYAQRQLGHLIPAPTQVQKKQGKARQQGQYQTRRFINV